MGFRHWIAVLVLLVSGVAHAQTPPRIELLFGPEEEFRNEKIRQNILFRLATGGVFGMALGHDTAAYDQDVVAEQIRAFLSYLEQYCQKHPVRECKVARLKEGNSLQFQTSSGMKEFFIRRDPAVMEIGVTPFRLRELDGELGEMWDWLLERLSEKNWSRSKIGGEGHVHFDFMSAFGLPDGRIDLRRYRNFLVDWINHNELYWGALHYDPKALGAEPPITNVKEELDYWKMIQRMDTAILKSGPIISAQDLQWNYFSPPLKLLGRVAALAIRFEKGTIEIRSLRGKKDLQEMKRVYRLIESRINHLARQEGLIPYYGGIAPANLQEAVDRFWLYVTESDEPWSEMQQLLPTSWRTVTPRKNIPQEQLYSGKSYEPSRIFRWKAWICNHLLAP